MIRLNNIVVKFGDFTALHDINVQVKEGEFFTFLGPSGCGKTTTLRTITGFIEPAEGQVFVRDKDITHVPIEDRNIGIVFQSYALFPTMTVYDNIAFGLRVKKMKKAEVDEKVRAIAKKVDLSDEQLRKAVSQLSGGQQQRVAIARALVTEPAIICLDEPLSNLDAKLRVQLRLELKKMQKDFGITSIYVTHDQEEALTLSDRIAVFNKGVIEQIGTPNEIYNHSATEFVCNFIGDINRLSDDIVEKLNAKGAQLDPTHHHYIRLERVHVNDAQHAESGAVSLSGTVESREYYGLYIKYYINVGSQTLKVIERNDGVHLHDTGDAVTVTVHPIKMLQIIGGVFFAYLFFGFMLLPCLNTLTSIFTVKNAAGETDPLAVIRFFLAGSMSQYVWNSLKLALCLVITVNVVGISIVLLTEYFDIKGAKILRLGYMTTLIYSGVALVTGYMFLYASDGIITTQLKDAFPNINVNWFTGFNAVLFTMTFACTSNHALFLRNAIRGIDYNTVEAARNMGAKPFKVLWKVVFPTLLPTLFSLTVMTFITGLCAMSAPTLLGYDSINPEIVRLAGSSVADEAFPQARAALLSIILACFTILLLTVLSSYERKGHYLSVSKTKAKLQKQKITNPVANVLAHIYAYVLFIIYMTPVVMIVIFSFQTFSAVRMRKLNLSQWTLVNYFGKQDYSYLTSRGTYKIREGSISGVFSNEATLSGIQMSFVMSVIAAALACVIVVVACNYIFKHKKTGTILEYALLFPWLLPTILICYSYRTFFNSSDVWYVFGQNLYYADRVRILIVIAYTVVKLPFSLRMIKASFYAIDEELEDAARNLGSGPVRTFLKVKLPIILPSVLAVFALNFNALFTEYDMSATFASTYGTTYAMVIQSMCREEGLYGYNVNASGRRCASTVFIMLVSGLILYLVYGVGARDLGERLEARDRRRKRMDRIKAVFRKKQPAEAASPQ